MVQGYELGVDLYGLWRAGQVLVPSVGDQFIDAANELAAARSDGAWFRSCDVGIGGLYGAGDAFGELADTLQTFLTQTRDNLHSTGEALVSAANNYDQMDNEARAEFEDRKRKLPN